MTEQKLLMTVNVTFKNWDIQTYTDVYHLFTFGNDLILRCGTPQNDHTHTIPRDELMKFDAFSNAWAEEL